MGLFEKIFKKEKTNKLFTNFKLLNNYNPIFYNYNGIAYDSDVVRACINAIASNTAKLKAKHIRYSEKNIEHCKDNIEYLLTIKPNEFMNAYDMLYKVVSQLYLKSNAFIYIKYEFGKIVGLYPINYNALSLLETSDGTLYARFSFTGGKTVTLPYDELIHLRRFFNENDIYGTRLESALNPTLDLINTSNQGIINAVKSSANLRGLLKFTAMLKPEDLKKQRDNFMEDYFNINNNGGVAAIDGKADYTELKGESKIIDDKQMALINDNVYKFFNINENIVKSKYNEDEWEAFYESVIEPIAIQLSLEFTSKLFTKRELEFGNQIIFESNRLQYASTKTKVELVNTLTPLGLLSINEGREIFNLSSVEGGDKRIISLNYVNAQRQDEYQKVNGGADDGTNDENGQSKKE